jgi:transposase
MKERKMSKFKTFNKLGQRKIYTENFKKSVVREVESGKITKEQARIKYNIKGHSSVLNWCRQYGKIKYTNTNSRLQIMNDKAAEDAYKKRIKDLEKQLSEAEIRGIYWQNVFTILDERGDLENLKKYDTTLSEKLKNTGTKRR